MILKAKFSLADISAGSDNQIGITPHKVKLADIGTGSYRRYSVKSSESLAGTVTTKLREVNSSNNYIGDAPVVKAVTSTRGSCTSKV